VPYKNTSIEVVVGIIHNSNNEVFIAKRQKNQFMSDYWELPGGKVEPGEDHVNAIKRELFEETGITVKNCKLVQKIQHIYPEKTINLSVYSIDDYLGGPVGLEGQEITWSSADKLKNFKLLPTMWRIIHKFSLPKFYWITPDNHQSDKVFNECKKRLSNGIKFIQLRSKTSLDTTYIEKIHRLCRENQAKLILNTPNKTFNETCDGWHLSSLELMSLKERPVIEEKLIGASTHGIDEALHAENISADYISLSPIEKTLTHPNSIPLGWKDASDIIEKCNLPVFLLGGMNKELVEKALSIGAQGVAGIRGI
jgi:8-oxo-dGTP diphosphatase